MVQVRPRPAVFTAFVLLLALLTAAPVLADPPRVERLDNGLGVVVQHLDRAPVVTIQVWVRAGSRLETDAERGITHQIEHMIFKGTPSRGLGRVAGEIEAAGGRINAYTTLDHTVYYTSLPSESWRVGLDVLGDAIQNSIFDAGELDREKQVVLEEWRRGQDNPQRLLAQILFDRAFTVHPYRNPVIGYKATIEGFTRQMILDYIAKWYTAERMTVVVVGDVPADEVLARTSDLFSSVPPGPRAVFEPPKERTDPGLRFTAVNGRVKQAYIAMGFAIPGLKNPEVPAYDLLSELLSGGRAALLTRTLWAEKGLVNSVGASAYTPLDTGLFWVSLSCDPAKLDQAVEGLLGLLDLSGKVDFSSQEMARAKLAFEAGVIREKETMSGQASKLGYFENLMGGLKAEARYMAAVEGLSPTAVRTVAARTFRPENAAVVAMLPQGAALPDKAWFQARLVAARKTSPAVTETAGTGDRVREMDLPGGAQLLVLEDHSLPLVAVEAVFRGGLLEEPADKAGLFQLMTSVWDRGAAGMTAEELDRRIEDMAGGLGASSGRNSASLSGRYLSRFIDDGLQLFAKVLLEPTFPEEELAKRKADQLAAIKQRLERPEVVAFGLFRQTVYQGHPYQRDALGSAETVGSLTREDLVALHKRIVRADNMVLAVVGDVDAKAVHKRLSGLLAGLEPGFEPTAEPSPPPLPQAGVSEATPGPGRAQVHTLFGFRGPAMGTLDAVALDVLAGALSGQSGRLFLELRDKRSLAYSLAAVNRAGAGLGAFAFYVGSAPQKADQVRTELKVQLAAVLERDLGEEEFIRSRAGLLADWVLDSQSLASRAQRMALYQRLGLGYDYERIYTERLRALTPDKVRLAARRWLGNGGQVWVTVGPRADEGAGSGQGQTAAD